VRFAWVANLPLQELRPVLLAWQTRMRGLDLLSAPTVVRTRKHRPAVLAQQPVCVKTDTSSGHRAGRSVFSKNAKQDRRGRSAEFQIPLLVYRGSGRKSAGLVVLEDTRQKPEPSCAATVQWVNTLLVACLRFISSRSPVAKTVRKTWPQIRLEISGPMRIMQDVDANQALKAFRV
jgi:hypothetical protein